MKRKPKNISLMDVVYILKSTLYHETPKNGNNELTNKRRTRACSHYLFNKANIHDIKLLKANKNTTETVQTAKKSFNFITSFIKRLVIFPGILMI